MEPRPRPAVAARDRAPDTLHHGAMHRAGRPCQDRPMQRESTHRSLPPNSAFGRPSPVRRKESARGEGASGSRRPRPEMPERTAPVSPEPDGPCAGVVPARTGLANEALRSTFPPFGPVRPSDSAEDRDGLARQTVTRRPHRRHLYGGAAQHGVGAVLPGQPGPCHQVPRGGDGPEGGSALARQQADLRHRPADRDHGADRRPLHGRHQGGADQRRRLLQLGRLFRG